MLFREQENLNSSWSFSLFKLLHFFALDSCQVNMTWIYTLLKKKYCNDVTEFSGIFFSFLLENIGKSTFNFNFWEWKSCFNFYDRWFLFPRKKKIMKSSVFFCFFSPNFNHMNHLHSAVSTDNLSNIKTKKSQLLWVAIRKVNRKETRELYGYEKHESKCWCHRKRIQFARDLRCVIYFRTNDGNFAERRSGID